MISFGMRQSSDGENKLREAYCFLLNLIYLYLARSEHQRDVRKCPFCYSVCLRVIRFALARRQQQNNAAVALLFLFYAFIIFSHADDCPNACSKCVFYLFSVIARVRMTR